ncbi:MAG TPA: hypothetical protein VLB27_09760, partial [candidate division Zixibacteria bacterium]|nr:hypothetical protein [candidate division Zixibacteria bacterium]
MRAQITNRPLSLALCGALAVCVALSCTSRYTMRLELAEDGQRRELSIDDVFYVNDAGVSSPLEDEFLIVAPGKLAAVALYYHDTSEAFTQGQQIIQYRPRRNYRLFWPLPANLERGRVPAPTVRPFIRDMDRFAEPLSVRVYQLAYGSLIIDSLKSSDIYATIDATFRNLGGDSLS